ncbi:MAG: tetratricopeptide repeat protein [Candidatus Eremiobacteraeota bacterium]|nr:tetratricopeptide repeat protein [Candidatus Eremiobacteraeota bacterium]
MRALVLLILALLAGCTVRMVTSYKLDARVTNEGNNLLTIEGESNLPEGAPVEAQLVDKGGRRLARGEGQVSDGHFFMVLDVGRVPGYTHHQLVVDFDPIVAPYTVTDLTGKRGEAMTGEQVEFEAGRYRLVKRLDLVLEVNDRQAGYRELERGDLAGAARELESHLQRNPRDVDATMRLAETYIQWRKAEQRAGTRAYALFQRVVDLAPDSEQAGRARLWISRIDAERRAREAQAELERSLKNGGRFRELKAIRPGRALGAISLGMPYRPLARRFAPLSRPDFSGDGVERVVFKDFNGVSVGVNRRTHRVVWAATESDFYELPNGLKVGSVIQEFRGRMRVRTPHYGKVSSDSEGYEVSYGDVAVDGLVLTFQRRTDPTFRLPVDRLYRITVVARDQDEEDKGSTQESEGK